MCIHVFYVNLYQHTYLSKTLPQARYQLTWTMSSAHINSMIWQSQEHGSTELLNQNIGHISSNININKKGNIGFVKWKQWLNDIEEWGTRPPEPLWFSSTHFSIRRQVYTALLALYSKLWQKRLWRRQKFEFQTAVLWNKWEIIQNTKESLVLAMQVGWFPIVLIASGSLRQLGPSHLPTSCKCK